MLYPTQTLSATTAASPRVVDAHGLLHMRAPKSARACDAADVVDGLAVVQNPTMRLAATAYGVSIGSVARALRLTPEERDKVRRGARPLVVPLRIPDVPSVPVPSAPIADAQYRLARLVQEVGLNTVLDLLAMSERVAA
jgi:hypothetical protein